LEVRPGIWFIAGENGGRYPYAHSLYIEGDNNILIDTGAGAGLKQLTEKTSHVLLTHYHRDHVTLNPLFHKASFAIHGNDAPGVESLEGFYQLSGLDRVDLEAYWKMVRQSGFVATKIDHYLDDGDVIDTGRFKIKALHLPGHTSGHCGFLLEDYEIVYAADIDLTSFGPWYGNIKSDPDQFRQSIKRLLSLKPKLLLTGHSRPITKRISEKLSLYESVLDQREEIIINELKESPLTVEQLAEKNIIYRNHNGRKILFFFEKVMLNKHLQSLAHRGVVAKLDDQRYVPV